MQHYSTVCCVYRGTLMPVVSWYKDGEAVDLAGGNIQLLEDTQTLRIGVVVEGVSRTLHGGGDEGDVGVKGGVILNHPQSDPT